MEFRFGDVVEILLWSDRTKTKQEVFIEGYHGEQYEVYTRTGGKKIVDQEQIIRIVHSPLSKVHEPSKGTLGGRCVVYGQTIPDRGDEVVTPQGRAIIINISSGSEAIWKTSLRNLFSPLTSEKVLELMLMRVSYLDCNGQISYDGKIEYLSYQKWWPFIVKRNIR